MTKKSILISGFIAILAFPIVSIAAPYTLEGKIINVADGDTVTLMTSDYTRHRIRLLGIDAPEKNQPYGNKAKKLMAKILMLKW